MNTLTVVIPSRNEEDFIAKCLDSIVNGEFPKEELKVFVCDGMSTDKTREIVKSYSERHPYIQLLQNDKKTTPYALNLGIKQTDSKYITILGAHAEVAKDYFTKSIDAFSANDQIGCTGGIITNEYHDTISNAIGNALSSSFGVGDAYFRTGKSSGYVDTVAFGTYKREVFNAIGLFDEQLARNQDDEFNFRLLKNGYKIYLDQSIKAKYYVRADFGKLWRQYGQYGYWKVFVNLKHKQITTLRQLVPLLFVLFIFAGALLSVIYPVLLKTYLAVWILYGLAGLFSSIRKSMKPQMIVLTLFAFLMVHLSYGIGYLWGIINFGIFSNKPGSKAESLTR